MGILANSEDPDEIPQKVAYHQGLQGLKYIFIWKQNSNPCPLDAYEPVYQFRSDSIQC